MKTLADISWEAYWEFLLVERKVKNTSKNKDAYYSRFNSFKKAFQEKEFSRVNFNKFIFALLGTGNKPSHINKFITMAKHVDWMLGTKQMEGFTRFKEEQSEVVSLSPDEIMKILEVKIPYKRYCAELNKRNFTVIHFLFQTGCRCDELQKLEWKDVCTTPETHVIFRDTKSRKDRTVYITQWMYDLLQELPRYGSRVFDSRNGNIFCAPEFNRTIKTLGHHAGLPPEVWTQISFHTFRHSRASYLAKYIDPFLLGSILGHNDVKVTMRYYHPSLSQLMNAAYNNPLQSSVVPEKQMARVMKEFIERMYDNNQFTINVDEVGNGSMTISVKRTS